MRSRPMTQVGRRPIQKVQKQAELEEEEARLQKDMESQGTNHDICYDSICLGLRPVPDPCPTPVQPPSVSAQTCRALHCVM